MIVYVVGKSIKVSIKQNNKNKIFEIYDKYISNIKPFKYEQYIMSIKEIHFF